MSILYAYDTDELTAADLAYLADNKLDLISLDCTNGFLELDYVDYMGMRENLRIRKLLIQNGTADEQTVFVAYHFSHNGLLPYEEMQARLQGFLISYDSMVLEIRKGWEKRKKAQRDSRRSEEDGYLFYSSTGRGKKRPRQ